MSRRKRSIFKERRKINYKLIFALVILACVAVLLISYAISAIVSQKDELYDQGVKYYKSGSYQEAIDSFDNALAENQLFSKKKDQNIKLYLADAYLKSAQLLMSPIRCLRAMKNMSRHLDSTRMYMPCTVHII